MLTAQIRCRRYRSPLIVGVASLIPSLKPCLQVEQPQPGDRGADEDACHHEWSHRGLLTP